MGDYHDRTALHLAASNGHLKMVRHLVMNHGADLAGKDCYGGTPLADAVRHKHDAVTAFLRSQGGSLGSDMDNAAEQLCRAGATDDVPALKRLIENLVDPNKADYDKRTALHLAASNNCLGALKYLIKVRRCTCRFTPG